MPQLVLPTNNLSLLPVIKFGYPQFYYFGEVFHKARIMTTWTNSLKAVFYGPGWTPGTPRLGDPTQFPVITAPRTKYNPQLPFWQLSYVFIHVVVTALMQQQLHTLYPVRYQQVLLNSRECQQVKFHKKVMRIRNGHSRLFHRNCVSSDSLVYIKKAE